MQKIIVFFCLIMLLSCKSKRPSSHTANAVTKGNVTKNTETKGTVTPNPETKGATTSDTLAKEKGRVLVNPEEVEAIKINRAYDLGKRLLETCNTSHFKAFTNQEATEQVINNATLEKITTVCKKINFRNGKFIALSLLTITYDEINDEYIFRYNIEYEKKYFKRELEVTVNSENKVSGIKTKEIKPKPM